MEGVAAGDFLLGTDGGIRTVQTSMVAVATLYLYDSSMFEKTDNGLEMCDMLGKIRRKHPVLHVALQARLSCQMSLYMDKHCFS